MSYAERLESCWITTLKERKNRGDAIQLSKSLKDLEIINWINLPTIVLVNVDPDTSKREEYYNNIIDSAARLTNTTNSYYFKILLKINFSLSEIKIYANLFQFFY